MRPIGASTIVAVVISLIAISSSAPMIAAAAAPALAIAFWRNAFAVGVLAPVAAVRRRDELRKLVRSRDGRRCALAGVALAVHFATWVPSAKLTSVATSVALVSTMPVWTALLAVVRGIRVPLPTWLGMAVATIGVAVASGADLTVSSRAVAGDALALAGAMAAAVYTTLGEQVRANTSTTSYTTICYSICAVGLGITCLVGGVNLTGFDGRTWLAIVAMTVGPQLLGHSLINYALHRISAPTMGVLLLLEVPGAALFAWLFLDQLPAARSLPGLVLLMAGVAVVVVGGRLSDERRYRDLPGRDGYHVS
jgi:drug/metabolite transporter (DMT)-like permease